MFKIRKVSCELGDKDLTDVEIQRDDSERPEHPVPNEMF